jgi:hypothetical protein
MRTTTRKTLRQFAYFIGVLLLLVAFALGMFASAYQIAHSAIQAAPTVVYDDDRPNHHGLCSTDPHWPFIPEFCDRRNRYESDTNKD